MSTARGEAALSASMRPLPYRLLVIAGGIYVILRHRANIRRLLSGTEPRLGQGSAEAKTAAQA